MDLFITIWRNVIMANTTTDIEQLISTKIEELKYVDGINGNKRLVKDVVRDIHKNTSWLTKPKLLIAVIIFIVSQVFIFGVWKGSIDEKFKGIKEIMTDIKDDAHQNQEDIKELLKEK